MTTTLMKTSRYSIWSSFGKLYFFKSDSADEEDMDKDELTKEEIEDEKNDLLNEADIPLEELMKMYQVPEDAATNEAQTEVKKSCEGGGFQFLFRLKKRATQKRENIPQL